jgi:prephenate dehydrogenase
MSDSILSDRSIVIFGGEGKWGRKIYDALREAGVGDPQVMPEQATQEAIITAVQNNDVVFFAIPDVETARMLRNLQHIFIQNPGKVLIDCASSKSAFADVLRDLAAKGTSVCSTHPMVSAEIYSVRGQNVIMLPVGDNSQDARSIAEYVFGDRLGMRSAEPQFDRIGDILEQHAELMVVLQMIPHLTHRVLLDVLGQSIPSRFGTIQAISKFAPANYLLSELAFGRVAIQESEISAEIIKAAIGTELGIQVLQKTQLAISKIADAAKVSKGELNKFFETGVSRLDLDREWRKGIRDKTEVALIRLGNLNSDSIKVRAKNEKGVLRNILNILVDDHGINMTALDSQTIDKRDDRMAIFDIGIDDKNVDFAKLRSDLDEIGVILVEPTDT